jgi:hypothetical protein
MPVILALGSMRQEGCKFEAGPDKKVVRPYFKNKTKPESVGGMAQVVEGLPSLRGALGPIPSTVKQKTKQNFKLKLVAFFIKC